MNTFKRQSKVDDAINRLLDNIVGKYARFASRSAYNNNIEETIDKIHTIIQHDMPPPSSNNCKYCKYVNIVNLFQ